MSRVVTFGEIMLRLATPGHARFQQAMPGGLHASFAGAEASIAASLSYLGADAAFVTALPANSIADACVADLRSLGVETKHILRTAGGRLGVYFLEHGANQRGGNVIYDREGSSVAITPAAEYDWGAIFVGCDWFVISGITPAISRNAAEVARVAMREAQGLGIKIVCDMNYRTKLWNWEPPLSARELATRTMRELLPMVSVFVGGVSDATAMLGIESSGDLQALARQIVAEFPNLSHAAFTLRDGSTAAAQCFGGALYEAVTDTLHTAPRLTITQVIDRLGAGDAFTAGLVFSFLQNSDPQTAIAFATAAGCLAHSIEGDYNYSTPSEIEALMQGDGGGRVSR
ncbi:sugar kinase [Prosthecobacter vanneervenii]|uniref:2-dehydro-3-deoxygluconokinase n=1 Tax=Prosthecobacter vanneervenii TaxID=48466 RepID=A0A7W8DLN2_9BACT|nr:sugar kinase [Prosthecobacter vanneervenii]MBB5034011.1 2-dehydro-3-deoxygluconokinase [Prosthecobacter vanneervenii]